MNTEEYNRDQFYRHNKWGTRIIKRGTDYDSAQVVKCKDFPDEVVLAKAMWPNDAINVVNEHNDTLAAALFKQNTK